MTIISKPTRPWYVYLQRPDTGQWVVVGRYRLIAEGGPGIFRYADSYRDAGLTWSIDPVNLHELFCRMVFNAVVGNDVDHPRYHAVIYIQAEKRWRLSPAFDVVPNPDETPKRLFMQVSAGTSAITRAALLADHARFAMPTIQAAETYLETLLSRMRTAFIDVRALLTVELQTLLQDRLDANTRLLQKSE